MKVSFDDIAKNPSGLTNLNDTAILLSGVLSSDYKQPGDLKEIVRMADSLINEVEMYII